MAAVNMTEGAIPRRLVGYAVPLVLSNLFQLTYNAVDSIVVGRFVGKEALAAVGTSAPVTNLLVLGISGLCIGASVIMSEFFGAGNEKQLRKELATTMVGGSVLAVLLTVLGMLCAQPLLRLMAVPGDVLELSGGYLRIVFLGVPFTFLYNATAYALKSVGDSRTPLAFLIFSSVLNVILDILFVGVMHGGALASGWATVFSQGLSAVLCIAYVRMRIPLLCIRREEWKPDRALLLRTLHDGGITALQQSCQPIGKILIQGAVNSLGVDAMAVFNVVGRMDDYACMPEQTISSAITTFMAQNRGAGKIRRMWDGFVSGMRIEAVYGVLIGLVTFLARRHIMLLFVDAGQTEVIRQGVTYLGWMSLFYLFPAMTNGVQGGFRGLRRMRMTLAGTLIQITFRVIFVFLLAPSMGVPGVAFASAIGWFFMLLVEVPILYMAWKSGKEELC
ncbi:MAG: MATE family efflux transporter [Clostridiales bacterium]|nr:MATE family efflux transporter [Clostridia bacterium]MCR4883090.1 MATE family efflux transporter [Clostridiales bacterium]